MLFTPDSKIKTSIPRQPIKSRMQVRQLNLAAITERNIIFNQMMTDASNNFANPISTPNSNANTVPMCPNAPRKNINHVPDNEIIKPRNISKDF